MKKILLIEDHAIVRFATKSIICNMYQHATIYEASTYKEALASAARPLDLILLDINLPDGEGFNMISRIRKIQSKVPVLVFSSQEEQTYALHYLKLGANGFLSKLSSEKEIEQAIHTVLETGTYASPALQEQVLRNMLEGRADEVNPLEKLSQRELQIMDMFLEGLWTKEIAARLNLTRSSVSTYKARIFQTLGVSTLIDLFKKVHSLRGQS